MMLYLETVIMQSIDLDINSRTDIKLGVMPPSTESPETDGEFLARLCIDSNAVACKKQV
jgi:hypothetical protein